MRLVFLVTITLLVAAGFMVFMDHEAKAHTAHNCHAIEVVVIDQHGTQLSSCALATVDQYPGGSQFVARDGSDVTASYCLTSPVGRPSYVTAHYAITQQGQTEKIDRILPVLEQPPTVGARANLNSHLCAYAYQSYNFFTYFTP